MTAPRVIAALLVAAVALAAGSGCRKPFEPGIFELTGVIQVARDAEGEEVGRSELRILGSAQWTFDFDGEFLVQYHNYGVGQERPCSGNFRGQYVLEEQQLRTRIQRSSLPAYCRPDAERVYQWQRGWGGTLTLERHWDENQYLVYRLEPAE